MVVLEVLVQVLLERGPAEHVEVDVMGLLVLPQSSPLLHPRDQALPETRRCLSLSKASDDEAILPS